MIEAYRAHAPYRYKVMSAFVYPFSHKIYQIFSKG